MKLAKTPARQIPYSKKPEESVIEFKVIDGLAVAYGDVLLGKPQEEIPMGRGWYDAPPVQKWDRSEIPYVISSDVPNPSRIENALAYFREHTPIRFVPYEGQKDAVVFEVGTKHCLSSLGRIGGLQSVKLSAECQTQEILHEIMHTLGFIHEHSRPDRDQYVQVQWNNIEKEYQDQFAIVPDTLFELGQNTPFDYHSIMLYRPHDFAIKQDLFTLLSSGSEPISPTQSGLSDEDLKKVNRVYEW